LLTERIREEAGYTLVEVMASIILLSFAILPMAGMFDMGIESATAGSNYDKARTLANLKLEEAKNLPFDSTNNAVQDLNDNFPELAGTTTAYDGSGHYQSAWKTVTGPASADFANFKYRIEKQYMAQPPQAPVSSSQNFVPSATTPPPKLIRVTVTVQWPDGSEYTTFGLVAP